MFVVVDILWSSFPFMLGTPFVFCVEEIKLKTKPALSLGNVFIKVEEKENNLIID